MQNHIKSVQNISVQNGLNKLAQNSLFKDALGMTSPVGYGSNLEISQKQIEILEDAIRRYERLEDIKRFSDLALEDIDCVTEEDIQRAIEIENMVSIEDEKAVLGLLQNEGFLKDLQSTDFSALLNQNLCPAEEISAYHNNLDDDFSDFDLD